MTQSNPYRNLANIITITRILGVGLIFWFTPYKTNLIFSWTIIIYTIICLTDFLDGWIARKLNIVSDVGKILDPLADKILVLVFLPLLEMQVISSFPVFIILAREFAIMALRVVSAKTGIINPAKFSGKLKTFITLPVCGILFGRVAVTEVSIPFYLQPLDQLRIFVFNWPSWMVTSLIWLTVAVTIWSFFDYFGTFIWDQNMIKAKGDKKKALNLIKQVIPNVVSSINLIFGCLASLVAYMGEVKTAVFFILLGILLDAVDGNLARRFNTESELGAKLDSKADYVSFGIAPSFVIFTVLRESLSFEYSIFFAGLSSLAYFLSVRYRLKRFDESDGHSKYFDGLPSPIGAALVTVGALSGYISSPIFYTILVATVSILMASKIPYLHNSSSKETFLKYFQIPTFIFFIMSIISLSPLHVPEFAFTFDILLGLTFVYVLSPLLIKSK